MFQSDELEEGEIAVSGDSPMDHQQSGSWIHDRDEVEDEQVLQPKVRRKRSLRVRPRHTVERPEEKSSNDMPYPQNSPSLRFQVDHKNQTHSKVDPELKMHGSPNVNKLDQSDSSSKVTRNLASKKHNNTSKLHASPKSSSRLNSMLTPGEDTTIYPRDNWDGKVNSSSTSVTKMSDVIQRRVCPLNYHIYV